MRDPHAYRLLISHLTHHVQSTYAHIDLFVGLDSRGFLLAPPLALALDGAFVPVRKAGKLPGECIRTTYKTEYSEASMELQKASIKPGQRVVIVDDLLATGGTLAGAVELIQEAGGVVEECLVVMELEGLKGREKIGKGIKVHSVFKY